MVIIQTALHFVANEFDVHPRTYRQRLPFEREMVLIIIRERKTKSK